MREDRSVVVGGSEKVDEEKDMKKSVKSSKPVNIGVKSNITSGVKSNITSGAKSNPILAQIKKISKGKESLKEGEK